jgi:DNA polymerase III epsilon subunit-like protein
MASNTSQENLVQPLRRALDSGQWLALDTETTGLKRDAEIIEIALVGPEGTWLHHLIRPQGVISQDAWRIHGLDEKKLAEAPLFEQRAGEIRKKMTGRLIFGFNVGFDRQLLWREFAQAGQPAPRCRWLCLSELIMRLRGVRVSLAQALRLFEVEIAGERHRAESDATATVSLARKIASLSL